MLLVDNLLAKPYRQTRMFFQGGLKSEVERS